MNAKPGIRMSIVLKSLLLLPWRALAWVVLFVWQFKDRYLQRRPDPIPASVEGIRATLAHTEEALADISNILDGGRSQNGLALAECWLRLQEQQTVLKAALATALADEARHPQALAA